ncbi:MAG: hypothetical protein K6U14_09230 [Firmicutes bacterium]|nr:hypothetical protein [Alicyclobacillaceae bacterium]MCL6497793.1 hypothetical protein [Bacillota bacterium]
MDSHEKRGPSSTFTFGVLAFLSYSLVAALVSYPGVKNLFHWVIGDGGDSPQNIWNIFWVRGWLFGQHPLYWTRSLFYPVGANLAWMTLALPASIVAGMLSPLMGLLGSYNIAVLVSLGVDGLSVFWLSRSLNVSVLGAFISGLAFMTTPYLMGQMLGHLDLLGAAGLAFTLGLFLRVLKNPRSSWMRYAWLGLALAFTTYSVEDYGLYALFACGLTAAITALLRYPAISWREVFRAWKRWALSAMVFVVLVSPLLYWLLFGPLHPVGTAHQSLGTPWVVDLLSFLTPDPWGFFRQLAPVWHLAPDLADGSGFPGYIVWVAMGVLIVEWRRLDTATRQFVKLWGIGAAVFGVLSMGPLLHVDGVRLPVPLPEALLEMLPFWKDTLPERFAVMTALFTSVLIGVTVDVMRSKPVLGRIGLMWVSVSALAGALVGLHPFRHSLAVAVAVFATALAITFLQLVRPSRADRWSLDLGMAAVAIIAIGSAPVPFPDTPMPPVPYQQLVRAAGGTDLYVPAVVPSTQIGSGSVAWMYVAAVVGRPAVEGYVSRIPQSTIAQVNHSAVLGYLWGMQFNPNPEESLRKKAKDDFPAFLHAHNVHAVIILLPEIAHPEANVSWLQRALGPKWEKYRYPGVAVVFVRRR